MVQKLSKEEIVATSRGAVLIRSFCQPGEIRQYLFDRHFGTGDDYTSLYRQESLSRAVSREGANLVLAVSESKKEMVGYGLLAYPEADERWAELGPKIMIEVKAIEVRRPWRSVGIAPGMLKLMLAYPRIEEKIVYLVGYSWTWDLKGKKLTGREYRLMLIKLFEPFGFKPYETNEPNVCLRTENILMCRVGQNVAQTIKDRFKWLRFGLSPWTWKL